MLKRFLLLFTVVALPFLAAPTSAGTTPADTVQTAVDAILVILRDDGLDRETKRERMRIIINENFDFRAMSQSTLATNWRKASKEEQARFVDLFAKLIESSYVGTVEEYTDETVTYPGSKVKGRKAVVNTLIVTSSTEVPVDYKLYSKADQWLVYDVVIEGVSLISNYRSSYQEIVKKEGFPGLLARMEAKIKELSEPSPATPAKAES